MAFAALLCATQLAYGATTAIAVGTWEELADAVENARADTPIILVKSVTCTNGKPLEVKSQSITIDLSGYDINRAASRAVSNGEAILVNGGELTITGTGTIKGGNNASGGGAIVVGSDSESKVTINSGVTISGNKGSRGAVEVKGGTFTQNGATITENVGSDAGGGVFVGSGAKFTLNKGSIAGNSATKGGGVFVDDGATFTMDKGSIAGNSAIKGGGVFVNSGGEFYLYTGSIKDNTATTGGGVYVKENPGYVQFGTGASSKITIDGNSKGNLCLCKDTIINMVNILGGSRIGVTVEDPPTIASPKRALTPGDSNWKSLSCYYSDDPRYVVQSAEIGKNLTSVLVSVWEMKSIDDTSWEVAKYWGSDAEVTIPSKWGDFPVKSVGRSAFQDNTGLTSITIPSCVASIEKEAFLGCSKLSNLTIEGELKTIGNTAFSGCENLTTFNLPGSLTSLGDLALGYHKSKVFFAGTQEQWDALTKGKLGFTNKTLVFEGGDAAIPGKANTLKAKGKSLAVKHAKLKKKSQTVKRTKAITVKKAKGTLSFKLKSVSKKKGKKYFKLSKKTAKKYFKVGKKKGSISLKKGLKKGTYKLKVAVPASGTKKYAMGTKVATVTIRVR